nr:tetratricopeptide repeat protein [uncultured Clostridium sp.]
MKRLLSLTLTLIFALMIVSCSNTVKTQTASELLNLGEKYLLELDYEQAIIQFTELIKIEPKNTRAYLGLAEAYIGNGEQDKAAAVLRQGLEQLPDNAELKTMLAELFPEDFMPKPSLQAESGLSLSANKFINIYDSLGYEAVFDEMRNEEFTDGIADEMDRLKNGPVIIKKDDKFGCGFYLVEDAVFVYIGEYEGLIRSGYGVWLIANPNDKGNYVFMGDWKRDSPNGEGKIIEKTDESTIEKQEGSTYAITVRTVGSFSNGIEEGSINLQWDMDDGHTHNWNLTAHNGLYEVVGSTDWSKNVVGFCTECNADLNGGEQIEGVLGFTK